ncbi:extracellular solute-binding protein [Paenibacillus sp. GCM10027629]|uniref:extracellular solute-binding protein n=1 Tax=Paenibacillus sp. GCM10027629 TaxID=3273414 RepID=UPI00362D8632
MTKIRRSRWLITLGIFLSCIVLFFVWRSLSEKTEVFPAIKMEALYNILSTSESKQMSYIQWKTSDEYNKFKPIPEHQAEIVVLAKDFSTSAEQSNIKVRHDPDKNALVVDWNDQRGWLEWQFNAPEDGLYDLTIDYMPIKGSFSPIIRGIQVDGKYPFAEAERIKLDRTWHDSQYPYERNAIGNEIRPVQAEVFAWSSTRVSDYSVSAEPLRWALKKGTHTIRMVGVKEPVSIYSLTLSAPQLIPSYTEYLAQNDASEAQEDWFQIIEAEQFKQKSSVSIRTLSVAEPFVQPDPKGRLVYNAIGGDTWKDAGDTLEWEITVPQAGRYAIDTKYFQGYNGHSSVYRTIKIDGKVPFQEMLHYKFEPNTELKIKPLSDAVGNAYQFYLTEGTHRLSMTADTSLIRPAILALYALNERMTDIEWDIRTVSGNYGFGSAQNMDESRVWEMDRYDPEMESKLQSLLSEMRTVRDYMNFLNQAVTDSTTALSASMNQLEELIDDVNDIPNNITVFSDMKSSINTWIKPIERQKIQLDYLVVRSPKAAPGLRLPNAWDKTAYTMTNFFRTFVQRYDTNEPQDDKTLTIWVQRGRDYYDLLQFMIEQDFTPKTGIKVSLNLMPDQKVLLMSSSAGTQPDIALGVGMETPIDFAMRGAAQDLSQFPSFEDVKTRFNPGVMRSYTFDGGTYGLPETQNMNMMFYRTDLFEELGLQPPDTWDDVLILLPTLQEHGMTFMYPKLPLINRPFMPQKPDFITAFNQQGVELYTSDGLKPDLASSASVAAFKQWTDWYTKYNLPRDVPVFFNHFRSGDIPIGVDDISTYIQLTVAAPELAGHWKMLPIPGAKQPDGKVSRWTSLGTTSAFMMKKSDKQEEAWKFLEWWTSDETQSRYASDIESFAGIEYRWQTANLAAMQSVTWPEEDLSMLNEQLAWAKNMPFVPGYYLLPREMDFAWNEVVLNGKPPKEALEKAQKSLDREMTRKQLEFGTTHKDDLSITPYDQPYRRESRP